MQTDPIFFVFELAILLMSAVVHEVAHGYAAYAMGDSTAKYQGRLTLNPLKHLDPFGSVILPALLLFSGSGFVFGWAKPVPFNPYNLKNQRWGEAIVASAGPLLNLVIAILFSIFIRIVIIFGYASAGLLTATGLVIFINLVLASFNLVPIPPLDGSKILFSLFPPGRPVPGREFLERYGLFVVLFFAIFLWGFFFPVIQFVFTFLTGISF